LLATLSISILTIILPFSPIGHIFGFTPLNFSTYLYLFLIVLLYIVSAEVTKRIFYSRVKL
jgi:Mg2+-importing ATPase